MFFFLVFSVFWQPVLAPLFSCAWTQWLGSALHTTHKACHIPYGSSLLGGWCCWHVSLFLSYWRGYTLLRWGYLLIEDWNYLPNSTFAFKVLNTTHNSSQSGPIYLTFKSFKHAFHSFNLLHLFAMFRISTCILKKKFFCFP